MRESTLVTVGKNGVNSDNRRKHPRLFRRLVAKFFIDQESFACISTDLSESGLFLRTNRGLNLDTIVDIELSLPDNKVSFLKGIVRRTVRTPLSSLKNGMGIEIVEKDETFIDFVKSLNNDAIGKHSVPESQTMPLSHYEVKNKDLENTVPERRKHERLKVEHMEISAEMPSATDVRIINISSSGILVKANRVLKIGKKYALKVEYADQVLFVKAAVVWSLLLHSLEDATGNIITMYIAGMQFMDVLKGEINRIIGLLEGDIQGDIYQPCAVKLKVSR